MREVAEQASPETLRRARDVVKQVAAIETGAIEGLYEVDRGFTMTAAAEVAAFAAALKEQEPKARSYIESQLRAYDFVLDIATEARPIAEAWIRELHQVICGEKATYYVETAVGPQEQALPLGKYKSRPNHVKLSSGEIHSYAPVEQTPSEMQRFVAELQSEEFGQAHPIVQAAYAHYGLVWIHPFADGNGRVARALASVYTYRAESVPILITAEQKRAYLTALRAADRGDRDAFVRFIFEKAVDTMRLIEESLRTAVLPTPDDLLTQLERTYITAGGFDHVAVDEAGYRLVDAFNSILNDRITLLRRAGRLQATLRPDNTAGPAPIGFRLPIVNGPRRMILSLSTQPPANASVERAYILYVPRNARRGDGIRIATGIDRTDVPIREVIEGGIPVAVELQLKMFADRILADQMVELQLQAQRRIDHLGY
jgi:Fic family protein